MGNFKAILLFAAVMAAPLWSGDYGPIIYASKNPTSKKSASYNWKQTHSSVCEKIEPMAMETGCAYHDLLKLHKTAVKDALVYLCKDKDGDFQIEPPLLFPSEAACQKLARVVGENYAGRPDYRPGKGWKPVVLK